jgi:polyisoprenoid-binding protein YceI
MKYVLFFIVLLFAQPSLAATWKLDPNQSRISFSGTHADKAFAGQIGSWSADIIFDPENLSASSVKASFDMSSLKTGDKTYDASLPQGEWLDSKKFATAQFTTQSITQKEEGRYEAVGTLTIKGQDIPVTFPFDLKIDGGKATMTAQFSLDRLALNIGKISDPAAEWVSKLIEIKINLSAQKI